jgi:hypothetical protein
MPAPEPGPATLDAINTLLGLDLVDCHEGLVGRNDLVAEHLPPLFGRPADTTSSSGTTASPCQERSKRVNASIAAPMSAGGSVTPLLRQRPIGRRGCAQASPPRSCVLHGASLSARSRALPLRAQAAAPLEAGGASATDEQRHSDHGHRPADRLSTLRFRLTRAYTQKRAPFHRACRCSRGSTTGVVTRSLRVLNGASARFRWLPEGRDLQGICASDASARFRRFPLAGCPLGCPGCRALPLLVEAVA